MPAAGEAEPSEALDLRLPPDRAVVPAAIAAAALPVLAATVAGGWSPRATTAALAASLPVLLLLLAGARRARRLVAVLRADIDRVEAAKRLAHIGSWTLDLGDGALQWSPATATIHDLPPERVPATLDAWLAALPEAGGTALRTALEDAIEERRLFSTEISVQGRDGDLRRVWVGGEPRTDGTGRVRALVGAVQDVTEQWRTDERLRLLTSVVVNLNDAVLVQAADPSDPSGGPIVYANAAFTRLTGWPEDAVMGRSPTFLRDPEADPLMLAIVHRALEAGTRARVEVLQRRRDGSRLWVEQGVAPIRDDRGEVSHWVTVLRDVTARRAAEAELVEAKEAAEAGARTKSDFLANMSHEIRTPMNGVMGMTALLLETELTPEQRDFAETIRKSATSLLSIINDVLDISKIEAGRLVLDRQPFALHDLLEEVAEVVLPDAHAKGLDVAVEIAPAVPARVVADEGRLRQVLLNLLGNAVKFTARGHVTVEAAAERVGATEVALAVTVADTGIGISADKLEAVFDKFTQAEASTTRRFGGTGLGLTISRELVRRMGGTIEVRSAVGEGSRFTVALTLPVADEVPLPAPRLAGRRVLLAVPFPREAAMLRGRLERLGAEVAVEESGALALAALRRAHAAGRPFDAVLVHSRGATVDAVTFARQVADEGLREATALVVLRATDERRGWERWQRLGYAAQVTRRLRRADLWRALDQALARPAEGATPAPAGPAAAPAAGPAPRAASPAVLLVEDHPVNQKLAVLLLTKLGCEVAIAEDGRAAVEQAQARRFDVVFMDCQMPVMDGFEATRAIRALPGDAAHVPVVAMTANAMAEDRARCLAAGMDDYIAKPVTPAAIRAALDQWVGRRSGEAARHDDAAGAPPAPAASAIA